MTSCSAMLERSDCIRITWSRAISICRTLYRWQVRPSGRAPAVSATIRRVRAGPNCKTHELDNLYVVDTSFFVSIGAVNPSLTAIANAMRVGDHILQRLG